jgi:hypothetical protein
LRGKKERKEKREVVDKRLAWGRRDSFTESIGAAVPLTISGARLANR